MNQLVMARNLSPQKKRRVEEESPNSPAPTPSVVLNGLNIGYTFNQNVEKRPGSNSKKSSSKKKMGWKGLDIAVRQYLNEPSEPNVFVVLPSYIVDNDDGLKWYIEGWEEFGDERVTLVTTPGIKGERSLDDLYTLRCAKEEDCQFVDNDNYNDWSTRVNKEQDPYYDPNLSEWLEENRSRLHVNYAFMANKFMPGKPFRFGRGRSRPSTPQKPGHSVSPPLSPPYMPSSSSAARPISPQGYPPHVTSSASAQPSYAGASGSAARPISISPSTTSMPSPPPSSPSPPSSTPPLSERLVGGANHDRLVTSGQKIWNPPAPILLTRLKMEMMEMGGKARNDDGWESYEYQESDCKHDPHSYSQSLLSKDVDVPLSYSSADDTLLARVARDLDADPSNEFLLGEIGRIKQKEAAAALKNSGAAQGPTNAEWGYLNKCRSALVGEVLDQLSMQVFKFGSNSKQKSWWFRCKNSGLWKRADPELSCIIK